MKFLKNVVLASLVLGILFLNSCKDKKTQKAVAKTKVIAIDSLFEDYYQFKLKINPLEGTNAGIEAYNSKITNYISADFQQDLITQYNTFLASINAIDQKSLSEADAISLKVMKWDCEIKKEGLENAMPTVASPMFDLPNISLMPINQIFSFHLHFATLTDIDGAQPFKTVKDYENWLLRIDEFLVWLKTAEANMQDGIAKNVVLPKVIIKKIIGQLEQFTNPDIDKHLFYGVVKEMPGTIAAADRERLDTAYKTMISTKLIPAYTQLTNFLTDTYLPAGTETAGIGALPNGDATYQYLIKYHTSTNMTPDEIFNLGKNEVARILQEMEKVKEEVGFKGDLQAFFNHVRTSKKQMPFTKPEQVLANFNAIHDQMKGNLNRLFDLTPKTPFEVRRTQAFREASASAEYIAGAKGKPGIFYVPIPDVSSYNKLQDEALFLHEAIPGHHYQLSLQQENKKLPSFLHAEGMGVYVEGWALYAESLGKELGLYKDPYQYFGMLSMEMHRAIRLVVDSGIHAKGWTREEAIRYSLDHEAESEASITAGIERYMVAPGQALAYKVGQLKIRALRNKAEQVLGNKFNIKAFHNEVLSSGSLPLVLLEEKINKWITKTKGVSITISKKETKPAAKLVLNNGKRWKANSETTVGITNMTKLVADFKDRETLVSYSKLRLDLKIELAEVFDNCTMKGEAHNQLHNFLLPIKDMFLELSTSKITTNKATIKKLKNHLALYDDYFVSLLDEV